MEHPHSSTALGMHVFHQAKSSRNRNTPGVRVEGINNGGGGPKDVLSPLVLLPPPPMPAYPREVKGQSWFFTTGRSPGATCLKGAEGRRVIKSTLETHKRTTTGERTAPGRTVHMQEDLECDLRRQVAIWRARWHWQNIVSPAGIPCSTPKPARWLCNVYQMSIALWTHKNTYKSSMATLIRGDHSLRGRRSLLGNRETFSRKFILSLIDILKGVY